MFCIIHHCISPPRPLLLSLWQVVMAHGPVTNRHGHNYSGHFLFRLFARSPRPSTRRKKIRLVQMVMLSVLFSIIIYFTALLRWTGHTKNEQEKGKKRIIPFPSFFSVSFNFFSECRFRIKICELNRIENRIAKWVIMKCNLLWLSAIQPVFHTV